MTVQFIAPTKRRGMTKARATRIFLSRNGICFNCRQQIRAGQSWFVEHPVPVAQGGSDDDADLWPSHTKCKPEKDAADAATKAKRDRMVTASWRPDGERKKPKIASRGFAKREPRHSATTPPTKRVGYFPEGT